MLWLYIHCLFPVKSHLRSEETCWLITPPPFSPTLPLSPHPEKKTKFFQIFRKWFFQLSLWGLYRMANYQFHLSTQRVCSYLSYAYLFAYRQYHNFIPKSSVQVYSISLRDNETSCIYTCLHLTSAIALFSCFIIFVTQFNSFNSNTKETKQRTWFNFKLYFTKKC